MAEHGTLEVGNTVKHEQWPEGETATIVSIMAFRHPHAIAKGNPTGIVKGERVCILDKEFPCYFGAVETDKAWMEAGLEKVDG